MIHPPADPSTPMPWYARCTRACARRPYTAALIATMLVASPTLFFGFFIDDYFLMLTLDGKTPFHTTFDLFQFSPGTPEANAPFQADGAMPWWALSDLKIHFMRPLSCAFMAFDRTVFGELAILYHAHTLLWYLLLCGAVAALFRRTLPVGAGALALLLYGIDESHWLPVGWWCNRNAIVAAAPAMWGVVAHLRWREDGWRPGLPLSLLGLTAGLAGGETAVGALGYLIAYEVLGRKDAWLVRARAMAPGLMLGVAYLLVYKALGYGVHGSGVYIDPVGEFGAFLGQVPQRTILLMGAMFLNIPCEPATLFTSLVFPLVLTGLLALGFIVWALRRTWPALPEPTRRAALWLAAGALLSLPPVLATFPSGRLLMLPSIGGAALLGIAAHAAWTQWNAKRPAMDRTVLVTIVVLHILVPPLLWSLMTVGVRHLDQRARDVLTWTQADDRPLEGRKVITICAYDPIMAIYPRLFRMYLGLPFPDTWHTLSAALADHRLTRVNDRQLELEIVDGELLANPIEHLIRSPQYPVRPGDIFSVDAFEVEVLSCGSHGPNKMRFTFPLPLEDPRYCWLTWRDAQHRPLTLPAIGESIELPRQPGLIERAVLFATPETPGTAMQSNP